MASYETTARTLVVRVDEIIQAPAVLEKWVGQEVTVQLGPREQVKDGQQAVFYTNVVQLGESVAVQSLGHRPPTAIPAALAGPAATPTEELASRQLQAELSDAHMVVTGRVTDVRVPQEAPAAPVAAADEPAQVQYYSEHDPLWREAVVQVDSVEKGTQSSQSVVVRFPASDDVRWQDDPKLQPGQSGVFILQQPPGQIAADSASLAAGAQPVYTVTTVRPSDQLGHIKQLIDTAPPSGTPSGAGRGTSRPSRGRRR